MSDHGDHAVAERDITDFYVFQKPGDPTRTILIMNVNPGAPARAKAFDPTALYEFKIDTNADAVAELAFRSRSRRQEPTSPTTNHRRMARPQRSGSRPAPPLPEPIMASRPSLRSHRSRSAPNPR